MYKPGELEKYVNEEVYPPSITVKVIHNDVSRSLVCPRFIQLLVTGAKFSPLTFPVEVYEKEREFVNFEHGTYNIIFK